VIETHRVLQSGRACSDVYLAAKGIILSLAVPQQGNAATKTKDVKQYNKDFYGAVRL